MPPGCDLLGGEEADFAGARRELEHVVAGLQRERVDEPDRDGHRLPADRSARADQPAACAPQRARLSLRYSSAEVIAIPAAAACQRACAAAS